ncbi:restriction endonuclease subunit S [Vibrio fluvialis]|nr:restriction endonuclease subunit S [Vibrio fluvialis]
MSFDNLPCGWKLVTLEDAMDAIIDYRGKTPKKTESGIPLITAKIVKGGYVLEPFEFIAEDNYDSWMVRGLPQVGDVVLTTEAPLGETAQLTSPNVALAQRIVTLRGKKGLLDNDFLLCALQSDFVQHQLESRASGSTVKGIKQSELRKVSLPIPPLHQQKKISQVLKSLSNKLVCNTQTNQTLEEMAQAIFKSWFVDFDPVKAKMNGEQPEGMDTATASLFPEKLVESEIGLIPEGWVETPLYDIAEYINGAAYKKFEPNNEGIGLPIVKIAELKAGITQKTGFSTVDMPSKYRLEDNDILFSWSGNPDTSIDTFVWALGEAWLNQHIFKVVPKSVLSRDYVLCLLKFMRPVFAEIARDKQTTGLGHVTVKDLKRLTVAVPSEELLTKFNEKVSALIAQNFSLVKQNQNLEKIRDTLLPKLLSGEIELVEQS